MHLVRLAGLIAVALLSTQAANVSAADATLTVTVTPPSGAVPLGGNVSIPVDVHLQLVNVVCPQPGTATVRLAVVEPAGAMQGIEYTLPSTVVFNVHGPQAWTVAGPWNADGALDQTVMLNVTVGANAIASHAHPMNVTGTFAATDISGCSTLPAGADYNQAVSQPLTVQTGAGTGGNGTSTNGPGPNTTETEASVSLPLAIQVLLLFALALGVVRRKK